VARTALTECPADAPAGITGRLTVFPVRLAGKAISRPVQATPPAGPETPGLDQRKSQTARPQKRREKKNYGNYIFLSLRRMCLNNFP